MIIAYMLSFVGGMLAMMAVDEWHHWRAAKRRAKAAQVASEPDLSTLKAYMEQYPTWKEPTKRDTSSAIALMDQVDSLIAHMDEAELDADIDEMQMRGW